MYEIFFDLRERPFDLTPDPRFLVLTDIHREALSNLEYAIASRKGITLLIGDAGSGKTTLIRAAIEKQPERVHCVHLNNPALTRSEFVEMLARRFELSEAAASSKTVLLLELEALLRRRHASGEVTVLIVDEAQSLPLDLLEEVRLLANIETDNEKLLCVIMAGQPELAARLNAPAMRQLKQRVGLRCALRPLTAQETAAYVAGRIKAAGGQAGQVFTREAVALMHERAGGLPRTVNVIADNALVTAFAANHRPVATETILEVCHDFDLNLEDDAQTEFKVATAPRAGRVLAVEQRLAADGMSDTVAPAPHRQLAPVPTRRWWIFSRNWV
jgi:general secretion pathway protein A